MYAVIEDRGKQYKVAQGDCIAIDLCDDATPGELITFDKVLFCSNDLAVHVGAPTVAGAKVVAQVEGDFKGKKTVHFTFRRRKASQRKVGHRQRYLRVRITEITAPEQEPLNPEPLNL